MSQMKSHTGITIESITGFMNHGKLDAVGFDRPIELAVRDQIIDPDERRVLLKILMQAEIAGLDTATRARIEQARATQIL